MEQHIETYYMSLGKKIGVIDADLLDNGTSFPNLALMKISGFAKTKGSIVDLITDYQRIDDYDHVFVSKVFSNTVVKDNVLSSENVSYGGTGFFGHEAPCLPEEIEHHFPDYHLYDDFLPKIPDAKRKNYTDYSIGFLTRGCFRKCGFCVNKRYDKSSLHSPVKEFLDTSRKYISLLDDNFLACADWREALDSIMNVGKPFLFRQGLDIRLMTKEKATKLASAKYKDYFTFAFDNIKDKEVIMDKLQLWREVTDIRTQVYVLVAYESLGVDDIVSAFERIYLLLDKKCYPYLMRYEDYTKSKYRGIYINLASWCNQPGLFKSMTFREFCMRKGVRVDYNHYKNHLGEYDKQGHPKGAAWRYLIEFEKEHPDIAKRYFDVEHPMLRH